MNLNGFISITFAPEEFMVVVIPISIFSQPCMDHIISCFSFNQELEHLCFCFTQPSILATLSCCHKFTKIKFTLLFLTNPTTLYQQCHKSNTHTHTHTLWHINKPGVVPHFLVPRTHLLLTSFVWNLLCKVVKDRIQHSLNVRGIKEKKKEHVISQWTKRNRIRFSCVMSVNWVQPPINGLYHQHKSPPLWLFSRMWHMWLSLTPVPC